MRKQLAGVFSVALLLAAGSVPAQEEGDLFGRLDTNKDGVVTSDEVPERQQALFERLLRNADRDGDKKLTKDEFQAGLRRDGVRGEDALRGPQDRGPGFRGRGGDSPEARRGPPEGAPDRRPEGAPDRRPDAVPDRRPDGPPRGGRFGGGPFGPGLFAILDNDRDGELSTAEIVGAGTALLKLDRNGDGKLTPNEIGVGGPPPGPFGRPGGDRPGEGRPGEFRPGQRGFGPGGPEAMRERLKQADTNNDGKISKDEAPPMLRERFDRLDANSDGFIDETELRGMFQGPREGDRPPPGRRGGDRPPGERRDGDRPAQ
jgi:Ca2+-binding EF-hand superfamily protein